MKMKLTPKQVEIITSGCVGGVGMEEDEIIIVEEGEWIQDGKCQYRSRIFEVDGKYWEYYQSRSGSPFTDWEYEESDEAIQVERKEVTRVIWEPVE